MGKKAAFRREIRRLVKQIVRQELLKYEAHVALPKRDEWVGLFDAVKAIYREHGTWPGLKGWTGPMDPSNGGFTVIDS